MLPETKRSVKRRRQGVYGTGKIVSSPIQPMKSKCTYINCQALVVKGLELPLLRYLTHGTKLLHLSCKLIHFSIDGIKTAKVSV